MIHDRAATSFVSRLSKGGRAGAVSESLKIIWRHDRHLDRGHLAGLRFRRALRGENQSAIPS